MSWTRVSSSLPCSRADGLPLERRPGCSQATRKFTAENITPNAAEWDEQHIFPRGIITRAADLGFGAIYVSAANGGIGMGRVEAALIIEAMAYGCPSTSAFISIHNMATWIIEKFGSQALRARFFTEAHQHGADFQLLSD